MLTVIATILLMGAKIMGLALLIALPLGTLYALGQHAREQSAQRAIDEAEAIIANVRR